MNKIQEFKNDRGNFEWLMEFIEVSEEHEFECKHKITIDAYNNAIIAIDKLANKYKLHDEKRREYDVWYEHHYLWPKMKKFFNKNSLDYFFEHALDELWWFSDEKETMIDFCNFIKKFAKDMKGSAKAEVIDLKDYGFKGNKLYIAYDDECEEYIILEGGKFIKYIQNSMSTLDDEYKEIWTQEIFKIIEKYE